jgi:hypothetical protein
VKARAFGMTPQKGFEFKLTHYLSAQPLCSTRYGGDNRQTPVFDDKQEELEHYQTMMAELKEKL